MVFKKTEGLSTRVRPNGMPDLSGYKLLLLSMTEYQM